MMFGDISDGIEEEVLRDLARQAYKALKSIEHPVCPSCAELDHKPDCEIWNAISAIYRHVIKEDLMREQLHELYTGLKKYSSSAVFHAPADEEPK